MTKIGSIIDFENKKNIFKILIIILIILILGTIRVDADTSGGFCGGDIVLVLDNSGSIDSTELAEMKEAVIEFSNYFLPATDSQIAVVNFSYYASLVQPFTSDINTVENSIESISSVGATNWEDALRIAGEQFPNRDDNPDLIVFASDGDPNTIGDYSNYITYSDEATTLSVERAIELNDSDVTIIALGIGNNILEFNLIKISTDISEDNVYIEVESFDEFSEALAELAKELCTVTITGSVVGISDEPIEGVIVQIVGAGTGFKAVTDENGEYEITGVPPGSFDIVAYKEGFYQNMEHFKYIYYPEAAGIIDIIFRLFREETGCQSDCTKSDGKCHAECDGINECHFYNEQAKIACTEPIPRLKGVIESYDATHKIVCCDGDPYEPKRAKLTFPEDAENIVTITRIVFWRGRFVRMITTIWD